MEQTLNAEAGLQAAGLNGERRMGRRFVQQTSLAGMTGDLVVTVGSLLLAGWITLRLAGEVPGFAKVQGSFGGPVAFGSLFFLALLMNQGMYEANKLLRLRQTLSVIFKAACVWLVGYLAVQSLLRLEDAPGRMYIAVAVGSLTFGMVAWRSAFNWVIDYEPIARCLRQRILFVGWSEHAASLAQAITCDRRHPYEITGCVPSAKGQYSTEPSRGTQRLGGYDDISSILEDEGVDILIVADMNPADGELIGLANLCEKSLVTFKVIPSCFEVLQLGLHLETVSGVPVLGVSRLPLDFPVNQILKRTTDIVGGILGMILTAPLVAIFGTLVYLESAGPVIYRQRRLGRDGECFWIYKIRSMRTDAESDGRVGWSTREDPRRLRIGSFMRRWNIDEIPQFWNVVRGEMSLVGPRPERPELIVDLRESIAHYNARHSIKPGITGWAQVNGFRGDTSLTERVRCDLFYMEKWGLFLDAQILFMTLFKRENAC